MQAVLPMLLVTVAIAQQADFAVDPVWFRNQVLISDLPHLASFQLPKEDPSRGLIVIEVRVDTTGTVISAEVLEAHSRALGNRLRDALSTGNSPEPETR